MFFPVKPRSEKPEKLKVQAPKADDTWARALKGYMGFLKGTGKSENTLKNYKSDLRTFSGYLEKSRLSFRNLNQRDFEHYSDYLQKNFKATNTRRRKLLTARSFYKYLSVRKKIAKTPAALVFPPQRYEKRPWIPSVEQIQKIQSMVIGENEIIQIRNHLMVALIAETGIRLTELVKLREEDFKNQKLCLDPQREALSLSEELANKVKAYISQLPNDFQFLFFGANRYGFQTERMSPRAVEMVFKRFADASGFSEFKPRSLRHFAAIGWLKGGLDEEQVKNRLGLKSDSTIYIYREILKNQRPAKSKIEVKKEE